MSRKRSCRFSSFRKKAFALSAAKRKLSRQIDIPLTTSGADTSQGGPHAPR